MRRPIDLLRARADVAYVRTRSGFEVDFLARLPDGSEELIQVCQSVDAPETLAREVRALEEAGTTHPAARRLLLTLESRLPFPETPPQVRILPAWAWMIQRRTGEGGQGDTNLLGRGRPACAAELGDYGAPGSTG